jgi:hypothetical protein
LILSPPVSHKRCLFPLVALGLALGLAACGQKAKPVNASKPLQQSFQSAEPPVQQAIANVTTSLKAGDYTEAARALTPVVTTHQLTGEQRKAVGVALQQINQAIAANPQLNTKEMYEMRRKLFAAGFGNSD